MTQCATRVGGHLVDDGRTHILPHQAAARQAFARGRDGNATGNMNSGQARRYGVRTLVGVALGGGRLP
jgi:hypothetical protein